MAIWKKFTEEADKIEAGLKNKLGQQEGRRTRPLPGQYPRFSSLGLDIALAVIGHQIILTSASPLVERVPQTH
jgi:hypothetical protein